MTKENVKLQCLTHLQNKIAFLRESIQALADDAAGDTKSTAGDKHETGRAMIQLEQERLSKQLQEVLDQQQQIALTDVTQTTEQVRNGSLVQTDKGYFFIAAAIGKLQVAGLPCMVISVQSPLGKVFLGKKSGDKAEFNGQRYVLQTVS